MAYASYPQGDSDRNGSPFSSQKNQVSSNKTILAKSFGYMSLGLVISAAVAFLVSFLFAKILVWTADPTTGKLNDNAANGYLIFMVASLVGLLIDGIIVNMTIARNKHSAWVPYIIYCVFMGAFLSSFMVIGVDFATIGESFLLTSAAFFAMFLIGYFSKANLNVFGMVLSLVLLLFLFFASFWGITILISGKAWDYYLYDLVVSGALLLVSILAVSVDAYNMKRLIAAGDGMKNLALYCAFSMYCDFVVILARVLLVLISLKGRDN